MSSPKSSESSFARSITGAASITSDCAGNASWMGDSSGRLSNRDATCSRSAANSSSSSSIPNSSSLSAAFGVVAMTAGAYPGGILGFACDAADGSVARVPALATSAMSVSKSTSPKSSEDGEGCDC
ncbi:uncharacterized protein M421DRAFT_302623 [Didymella exigua CBS 183.55]|uniref:Uncharacterized protein n=1 Tax=Didymella exigua CBS 183.55 TaxID=1150837 RepID=A0A6A5R9V3_9PLEO|nr:uncharacterized protein M421DRAFT_302623 [Didymella exigua CBS 183.55]KAF1923978.1 hypothetical protein M421DRAFT_302623 [Didymella exigua CBS 183.55]